jgi:alpha-tubulin suppressor-like RCC1 family protein
MTSVASLLRARILTWVLLAAMILLPRAGLAAPAPSITTQPQNQSVRVGSNAVFTVVASGEVPLAYRWSFNGTNLTNSAHIGGATSARLTITNVIAADAGDYRVVVNNHQGSATSSNATLTVLLPPVITAQPTNQAVNSLNTATFSVTASGTAPLSFQWWFNGLVLPAQTNSSLILTNVQATNAGNYAVVVTNSYGSATSAVATLTVWLPSSIIQQPQSLSVMWGANAFFSVIATNPQPMTYQWWFNGTNLLAGQTNSTLSLTNVQPSQAGNYAVGVASPGWVVYSLDAALTVSLPPPGVPFITGFSPATAIPGATVTIFGANFSSTAASNVVYFGAVRAPVISASATSLTVTVPSGATFAPITETVGGLTAFSSALFLPTFPGDGSAVNSPTFAPRQNLGAPNGPMQTVIADMDGDGKPDLVVANVYAHIISIFQNVGAPGSLGTNSFAARVDLPALGGSSDNPIGMTVADVDGDGKLDILICDRNANQIKIYRNISTPGALTTNSFAAPVALATGGDARHLRVVDVDGDGKPDIVVADWGADLISIFRNIGAPGSLAFAPRVDFPAGAGIYDLVVADLDGDGKPDIAWSNPVIPDIAVIRNTSVPGTIDANSFTAATNFIPVGDSESIVAVDVDGDGKLDLIVGSVLGNAMSVLRNQSVPGTFSFAPHVDFGAPGWVHDVRAGDINGDGKPDICIDGELNSYMAVFQNGSAPGSFTGASLSNQVDFASGWNAWGISVGDLDGDGRADVVLANSYDNNISIYQNQAPYSGPPIIFSQTANLTLLANNTATFKAVVMGQSPLNYQWYFNGTNLTDGPHFAGSGTSGLAVLNAQPADSGNYYLIVTNSIGSATSAVVTLTVLFPPNIVIQPANPAVPVGSNITLMATGTGASPMSYQWRKDGTNLTDGGNITGAATPALALANLQLGDAGTYSVVVTNIYGSVTNSTTLRVTVPAGTWVKWDAGLGGNGHWYKGVVNTTGLNWTQADQIARGEGGYLATITSAAENDFVFNLVNDPQFFSGNGGNGSGPALGGVRTNSTSPAGADWTWETGEPWSYTAWAAGQPDFPGETRLQFWSGVQGSPSPNWNNLSPADSNLGGYVVEREDYPSIVFQPTDATVALGTNVSFMVVALGSPTLTYQWVANGTNIDGATNASLLLTNVQFAHAGNYFVAVSNAFGTVSSSNATLTVMAPPAITQSPTNVTLTAGATATFNAMVTGDPPLSYQWRFNGSPLGDSLHIAGSATGTLTISNVQNSDMGNYSLTVTNPVGSAISTAAVLTVLTPPSITTQPVGRSTPLGLTNIFAASASGTATLSYQWRLNGADIPGATNTSYFIAAVGTNDLGVYQFVASNAVGVAVSSNALLTVGPVAAWGFNGYSQCLMPPGLSNVTTVAGGYYYSLASRLDGSIAAWGLTSGSTNSSMTNVIALSANAGGMLALRADGSVVGSVGVNPLSFKVFPSNVVAVAAGYGHGLALRAEGTVVGWGNPQVGGSSYSPAIVPPGLTKVTAVAAGYQHSMALRSDGTVVAWGFGVATNVPVGLSNVAAIAAGQTHSLALKSDGTLVAWGSGAGTNIPAGLSNVMAIAAGGYLDQRTGTSMALRSNGTVVAWGVTAYSSQTNVPAGLTNVVAIADGSYHCLALVNDPASAGPQILRQLVGATAWSGRDWTLQVVAAGTAPLNYQWLFNGTNLDGATNANLLLPAIQSASAGNYQVIVSNALGVAASLAAPLTVMDSAPFLLTQPATNLSVYLGSRTVLASAVAGSGPLQYQWQFNGANIDGATNDTLAFDRVHLANAGNYVLWATNAFGFATSSIVKLTVRQVAVWGDSSYGQTNMPSGLTNVAAISANFYGNIALRQDGTITIWGNTGYVPTNTAAGVSNVVEVSAGYYFDLVLNSNGRPYAWGYNVTSVFSNALVNQSNLVAIAAGNLNCALLKNDGTVVRVTANGASVVTGLTNAISVEPFDDGFIALRADGTVFSQAGGFSPPSTLTNVLSIASARYQGLMVKRDGTLQDWPLSLLPAGTSGIIAVAAGGFNAGPEFAVRSDGTIITGGSSVATNIPYGLARVWRLDAGNAHCLALLADRDFPPVFLHNALNTSSFVVSSKGAPQWFGQTNISRDGVSAAQSAPIGNNLSSSMRMWVAGPITVQFWWKVSSAASHGVLSFTAGRTVLTNISGEVDWQQCTVGVPAGNQILQWTYAKDGSAAAGQDAAWVDQLQLIPQPPVISTQPASQDVVGPTNVVLNVGVTGTPPLVYRWWKDGSLVPGANAASLTLLNAVRTNSGTYRVVVTNTANSVTSSNAVLKVLVPQFLGSPKLLPDGTFLLTSADANGGLLQLSDLANFEVQVSTDLVNWATMPGLLILTNGTLQLQDYGSIYSSVRFYRIVEH